MKIAILSRYQETINRGAENFVTELCKRLSEKHDVRILTGRDSDSLSKIIGGKYNLVIPINGRLQSFKVSLGRFISGYKLLITGHSGIGADDIWNILMAPDVFVALTDQQRNWAKKWAWRSSIVKIPNGIDLNKFTHNGGKIKIDLPRPIILSVGALSWYKYHDRTIKAVSRLNTGSLLIIGEGERREDLNNLGKTLLGDRFKIMQFRYEDMPKVYRSCDLFTLPSWDREAFGIVYLEALASGLGVVAPDDVSRREIIGDAGVFVEVTDSTKYAKAIEQALKIGWPQKARKQAEKFSWEKVSKQYEDAILRILNFS